jgi:hypothetical protein
MPTKTAATATGHCLCKGVQYAVHGPLRPANVPSDLIPPLEMGVSAPGVL